jgi:hypothetical protein
MSALVLWSPVRPSRIAEVLVTRVDTAVPPSSTPL